jgi:hypothetical protein
MFYDHDAQDFRSGSQYHDNDEVMFPLAFSSSKAMVLEGIAWSFLYLAIA